MRIMTARDIITNMEADIAAVRKTADEGVDEVRLLQSLLAIDSRYKLDIRQRLAALGQRPGHGWDPAVSIT